jgi:hypothetical protein
MTGWLIDENRPATIADLHEDPHRLSMRSPSVNLAVRMNDVVIHDTRKWFGGADIRIDAIVLHGGRAEDGAERDGFYHPSTFRFSGIRDGDQLPIGDPGMLVFYGRPRHFLDIAILVSRDRRDSQDLGQLIGAHLAAPEWQQAAGALLGLAVAAPTATAVVAGVGAAALLIDLATRALAATTGSTIGLYRTSFLQHRDRFGLGRHPRAESYRANGLSFWYEVVLDQRRAR